MMSVGIQQTGGFSEEQMQAGVRFEETVHQVQGAEVLSVSDHLVL